MEKTELNKLINRFEESSTHAAELTDSLSSFNGILKSVEEQIKPLGEANAFLTESDILSKLDETSKKVLDISSKLKTKMSTMDGYIKNVKDVSGNSSGNVSSLISGLQGISDQLTEFNTEVTPSVSSIESQLSTIAAFNIEKTAKDLSDQLIDFFKQVISNYKSVTQNIDSLKVTNKDYQDAMTNSYNDYSDQISTNYEKALSSQQTFSDKMSEIVNLHKSLNATLSEIESNNVKSLDHFNELCDLWAQDNIYKASLKNKGIKTRLVVRGAIFLILATSFILNIELAFDSIISKFISNTIR